MKRHKLFFCPCRLLIIFCKQFGPISSGYNLLNNLMVFLKDLYEKAYFKEKNQSMTKGMQNIQLTKSSGKLDKVRLTLAYKINNNQNMTPPNRHFMS